MLKNINDNIGYTNIEFVLLDYNSQDDMEEWVRENLSEHISSGKVVYYKTFEPSSFKHSHSKNLVFKLANSEIVCSINADHYAGENFAHYVNECFAYNKNIVLSPIPPLFFINDAEHPAGDVWGLVCLQKNDFLNVRGFDERMINYGNEDIDFIHRLEMLNLERKPVKKSFLSGYIEHSDSERHSSIIKTDKLHAIYVRYISPCSSELIFLFQDKIYERAVLTNNLVKGSEDHRFSFLPRNPASHFSFENVERLGAWKEEENKLSFTHNNDTSFSMFKDENVLHSAGGHKVYYQLKDPAVIENIFSFYYFSFNTSIMQQNLSNKTIQVNPNGFGNAVVYKNFDYSNPISI